MSVILFGARGSGKTTIGRKLASRLWQTFLDTDQMITQRAGKTIADIFAQEGEPAFRTLEAQVIADALKLDDHIIALGGGAVTAPTTQDLLKSSSHKRIYLRCDPAVLSQRIAADPQTAATRPALLAGSVNAADPAEIRKLLDIREPLYRACMSAELDVTHLSPDEAVVYIVRLL